jgi:hypothetical protein
MFRYSIMLSDLALLAVDKVAYNDGLRQFQEGVSIMGAAVLVGAIALLFSKRFRGLGLILCMIAIGIIIYPWRAFAPIP